jgi:OOP family OmpA-OmpF porin
VVAALKVPGLEALLEGDRLYTGGATSDAGLATVRDRLKALLPGLQVTSLEDRATAAVRSASERTLAALKALVPGFAASDLAGALNLSVINFASGSAEVPADSRPLLQEAAAAIKAAPAGTLIEIAGHTDSTADAATNLPLSQARAEAVRAVLIEFGAPADRLTAKGYGDTQPVATNDTPDGRFQNRRIEYRVIR